MITRQEYGKLQVSRDRLLEKQRKIKAEIETGERETAEMQTIAARLSAIRREADDESHRCHAELAQLRHQVEKANGERKFFNFDGVKASFFGFDQHKLVSGRVRLTELAAEIRKIADRISAHLQAERELDAETAALERYCHRCDRISKKIPSAMRILLRVVDCESDLSGIQKARVCQNGHFTERSSESAALERERSELSAKHEALARNHGAIACELESWELLIGSKFADLKAMSALIQKVNGEIESECESEAAARTAAARGRAEFAEWSQHHSDLWREVDAEVAELRASPDVGGIEVGKKRALIAQLEHKLEELRSAVMRQRGEAPQVARLNARLEDEVRERQLAEEEYARGKERIERLRKTLELKERVIEDLGRWCPLQSKVKVRPGIEELLFVYEVALTRNRDMAGNLQVLTQEIGGLEAERLRLLAG
jgi:hypothetical protein